MDKLYRENTWWGSVQKLQVNYGNKRHPKPPCFFFFVLSVCGYREGLDYVSSEEASFQNSKKAGALKFHIEHKRELPSLEAWQVHVSQVNILASCSELLVTGAGSWWVVVSVSSWPWGFTVTGGAGVSSPCASFHRAASWDSSLV